MFRVGLITTGLLTCSNVFMTFAWYAHLRNLRGRAWYVAALISWSISPLTLAFGISHVAFTLRYPVEP